MDVSVQELKDALKSQVTAINALVSRESELLAFLKDNIKDHERRLRVIERILAYGVAGVGVAWALLKQFGKI